MPLTVQDWHQRFVQQTHWTNTLQGYIINRTGLNKSRRILEIGSGTGAVTSALRAYLPEENQVEIFGLDLNWGYLNFAQLQDTQSNLIQGDGHMLPFPAGLFDATYCHFLLLWVSNPMNVVQEMLRVTRPAGIVIAMAEPDYGGRIDYPEDLIRIGQLQTHSLEIQGADPYLGRKLAGIFSYAGLENIEFGVLGGQWDRRNYPGINESELDVLRYDLETLLTHEEITQVQRSEAASRSKGDRVLFIPTFYAFGHVPA
jgi:ubiquinone/menaquinone biosynthesis C-methylase UbiE